MPMVGWTWCCRRPNLQDLDLTDLPCSREIVHVVASRCGMGPAGDKRTQWRQRLGAEEGTRTPTSLRIHGPEPCASANSATSAQCGDCRERRRGQTLRYYCCK